jgi:predicted ATPase/transcriptional regulator with XRE-family HTH domain
MARGQDVAVELEADDRLGASLKKMRLAAGMTQEELAERAGVSARTVSDLERGLRSVVHRDTANRLASALGLADEQRRKFDALARGRETSPLPVPQAGPLPHMPTPLLGRSHELEVISAALEGSDVRLLTLTGPGGIGKTRLALEAARRIQGAFVGGVFFVSLGDVKDALLVAPELAKAIGVVETGADLQELIIKRLAGPRTLVVLDTFEHLVPAAPLVYAVLLNASDTTFLVTSRSALRLRGEHEFPVPPLELPTERGEVTPEEITRWPATALFWDRAKAVRPDMELDPPTALLVADICRKLDGLPLAIELAAARIKHLPLTAVRDQLDYRLQLLVGGQLDLPLRQRAMRDTVAWSHDLLGIRESKLFRRLSAFSGGWSLRAVENVCGSVDEVGHALDGISTLVDQNLVALDRNDPDARYDMLGVIREYAAQRLLEAGETEEIRRRHALHYLVVAEEAEPNLVRVGHEEWFRRLDVERGNLRLAMAWAIERGETVLALRYTAALWRYWRQLGEFVEGRRWSEAALSMSGEAPASLRAKALGAASALALPQGDYVRLAEVAAEATRLALQTNDPMDLRNALTVTGLVAMGERRYGDALEPFRESLAICRRLGLSWQLATSHLNLGVALLSAGSPEDADDSFEEGLRVYRQLGDDIFAARITNASAHAALARDDIERADRLARSALAEVSRHGERQGIAEGLVTLAAVAAARSDPDRAATLSGAAAAIRETIAFQQAPFELVITQSLLERVRKTMGEGRWHISWEAGHALNAESAVALALN